MQERRFNGTFALGCLCEEKWGRWWVNITKAHSVAHGRRHDKRKRQRSGCTGSSIRHEQSTHARKLRIPSPLPRLPCAYLSVSELHVREEQGRVDSAEAKACRYYCLAALQWLGGAALDAHQAALLLLSCETRRRQVRRRRRALLM